jgi:hypothetical protein
MDDRRVHPAAVESKPTALATASAKIRWRSTGGRAEAGVRRSSIA